MRVKFVYFGLIAAIFGLASLHFSFHQNALAPVSYKAESEWQLDFVAIENRLQSLRADAQGGLLLTAETESLLRFIYHEIARTKSVQKELGRFQFLSKRALPQSISNEFISLVNQYFLYQSAIQKSKLAPAKTLQTKRARQAEREAKQRTFFSEELASILFDKQNATTNYLHQRQAVLTSSSLSEAQKQAELKKLESVYRQQTKHPANDSE